MPSIWPEGSVFVLLNGSAPQITQSPNLRRVEQHYRIGPARHGYDDPSYRHVVRAFEGNGLRPYSPCHLRADRQPNGAYDVNWIRRTRIDGDAWEGADVPLREESESYLVQVFHEGEVVREVTQDSPAWSYSAADQASDGVTVAFDISVAQLSAAFGSGPATSLRVVL